MLYLKMMIFQYFPVRYLQFPQGNDSFLGIHSSPYGWLVLTVKDRDIQRQDVRLPSILSNDVGWTSDLPVCTNIMYIYIIIYIFMRCDFKMAYLPTILPQQWSTDVGLNIWSIPAPWLWVHLKIWLPNLLIWGVLRPSKYPWKCGKVQHKDLLNSYYPYSSPKIW